MRKGKVIANTWNFIVLLVQKAKVSGKPWQFIDLMRKGKDKLSDKLRRFIDMMRKAKGKLSGELWKLIALIILEAGVWVLGSWLVVRFFPTNEAIHNAIGILFIFAVGITVILYGNATKNRNLNVLGFAVFLFAIYSVIDKYEGFAVKISAFATVAVAFAAFAAIDENRRMRLERQEQEQKERKERMLNEIISWATAILTNMMILSRFAANQSVLKERFMDCRAELVLSVAKSIKVLAICSSLSLRTQISASDVDRIKTSMKLVDKSLRDFVVMLLDFDVDSMTTESLKIYADAVSSLSLELRSLVEMASEIAVA